MSVLKVPKYPKNESSFELEEMLQTPKRKNPPPFDTRVKPDYSPLKEVRSKGKVKK